MNGLFQLPPAGSVEYKSRSVLLFGFLFLVGGSVMLLRIPYLYHLKSRVDFGLQVPAKILRIDLGVGRSSPVLVEYEYQLGERVIKGDRASIFSESDGLYFRLRQAFDSGREVICFVDPDRPEFSTLEKDVRIIDLIGNIGLGLPFSYIGGLYLVRFFGFPKRKNQWHR